jgi:signal transduction histidine kinase
VLIVAFALATGAGLLYFVLQRNLLSGLDDAATARSAEVATQLRNSVNDAPEDIHDAMDDRLKADAHEGQLVQVIGRDNEVLATSSSTPGMGSLTGLRPKDGQLLKESAGVFKILGSKRPFLAQARGVKLEDGQTYTVIVVSFTEGLRESVQTVLKLLLIGFPGVLLLVGLAIWVLIGKALKPVEQIRLRVAGIGAAQLDGARVPIPPTRDEIAWLAITMNKMLDRLQAAQQAQRQFVADASHELRSPLATLSASLEVADADETGRAWRELRDVMASEAARMAALVENLLLLARADDQGLEIIPVEVDLDDLIEAEVRRLRTSSTLIVTTSIEPARVLGDRLKLSQVLRNLVDNASRHARSRVRLELAVVADTAVITVDDDGPGVPEVDRERVFQRFVRLDESRDRASGGAGLGLPIVREVVRVHQGLVVLGAGPDGGCRVIVQLPIQVHRGIPDAPEPPDPTDASDRVRQSDQPPVVDSR